MLSDAELERSVTTIETGLFKPSMATVIEAVRSMNALLSDLRQLREAVKNIPHSDNKKYHDGSIRCVFSAGLRYIHECTPANCVKVGFGG